MPCIGLTNAKNYPPTPVTGKHDVNRVTYYINRKKESDQ